MWSVSARATPGPPCSNDCWQLGCELCVCGRKIKAWYMVKKIEPCRNKCSFFKSLSVFIFQLSPLHLGSPDVWVSFLPQLPQDPSTDSSTVVTNKTAANKQLPILSHAMQWTYTATSEARVGWGMSPTNGQTPPWSYAHRRVECMCGCHHGKAGQGGGFKSFGVNVAFQSWTVVSFGSWHAHTGDG